MSGSAEEGLGSEPQFWGTFLVIQWLTLRALKAGGMGLIPAWGTTIPCLESSAELKKVLKPGPTLKGSDFNDLKYRLMALQAPKGTPMCNQGSEP